MRTTRCILTFALAIASAAALALTSGVRAQAQPADAPAPAAAQATEPPPAGAPLPEADALRERAEDAARELDAHESRLAALDALRSDTHARAAALLALEADVRARATAVGGRLQIGAILRRAKASLPDARALRASARSALREANRLDDRAFELQEERERLAQALATPAGAAPDPALDGARFIAQQLDSTLATSASAISAPGGLIERLHERAATLGDMAERAEGFARFVNERVLWVRSDTAFGRAHVRALVAAGRGLASPERWLGVVQAMSADREAGLVGGAGLVLAGLVALVVRTAAARRLHPLLLRADQPTGHGFRAISEALALVALRAGAAPVVLILASNTVASIGGAGGAPALAIASALKALALPLFLASALRSLAEKGGVAEAFLHASPARLGAARAHLAWATPALCATLAAHAFARALGDDPEARILRRLAFIALCLVAGGVVAVTLRPRGAMLAPQPSDLPVRRRSPGLRIAHGLGSWAFVALALMTALGWTFSAEAIALHLWESILIIGVVALVRAVAMKWVHTLHHRAQQKPAVPADLGAAHRQAASLVNVLCALATFGLLWPVWAEVFPALSRLDSIGILPAGFIDSEALRQGGAYVLTVRDAALALVIAALGLYAQRSIPQMLDGLALSRTHLDAGARYAIQTILKYALLGVTVFLILGALRTKWGNVGWVLGGLSVGIGLGLQEFIGNLVAGVSLLFERTIRPGDRVQVGEHLGVVKEITIRSTTLADFRRRDVIVPNRLLLSGVVINETRTDRTAVASFAVGVAYGADLDAARSLILGACSAHAEVEEVTVNAESFGDSAVTLRVSATVTEVDRRPEVTSELLVAIEKACRDHGVEIAFPRRDLNVRGGEIVVRLRGDAGAPDDPAPRRS